MNLGHELIASMVTFLSAESTTSGQRKTLKLLIENLCDGVVEQERTTVARERWRTLNRELRELLGGLHESKYEALVVRR